jgi:hypothetical protein
MESRLQLVWRNQALEGATNTASLATAGFVEGASISGDDDTYFLLQSVFPTPSGQTPEYHAFGTVGGTMPNPTREETEAQISAAEARTETKIARLEGKLDLVLLKLDDVGARVSDVRSDVKEENRTTRANAWVIGMGLAVLIVTIAALYPTFFGMGAQVRDMVQKEVQQQAPKPVSPPKPISRQK